MLTNANVKAYIESRMKRLESAKLASAKEVLDYLTSSYAVMRGEQTETVATAKGIFEGIEVSAKDRITAAKELLKRYPSDPISNAQLRKMVAEAKMAEYKVEQLNSDDLDTTVNINFNIPKEDNNASES